MARTVLATQRTTRAGIALTFSAAPVDGHGIDNAGEDVMLYVKNGGASPITVTVLTPRTIDGLALPDLTVTIPNAGERIIGPFPNDLYAAEDTELDITKCVQVNFSAVTSVTVAAVRLGSKALA